MQKHEIKSVELSAYFEAAYQKGYMHGLEDMLEFLKQPSVENQKSFINKIAHVFQDDELKQELLSAINKAINETREELQ